MARLDYYAIEEKIAEILRADPLLSGVEVRVEGELDFQAGLAPWVGVYLDRRDPAQQVLDAGRSTTYRLRFTLWAWTVSIEAIADAIRARDELLGKLETVLMNNRTIGDLVSMSWIEGGEMPSGKLEGNTGGIYMSGAEIALIAEARTSVT